MRTRKADKKLLRVCATCPWLKANHGKPHPSKWYSPANLRRLWDGLRSGEAPGMVCHSTDAESADYGGTKKVKEGVKQECAGALNLVIKHFNEAGEVGIREYRTRHRRALTTKGIAAWLDRRLTPRSLGGMPPVEDRSSEVGLPWDRAD